MAKPTLTVFTAPQDFGIVVKEEVQIVVKYSELNVPFSDTTGNTSLNWKGKTRLIIIQFIQDGSLYDGTTQDQRLSDFVFTVEQWVNSSVQTTKVYTDSVGNAYDVVCHDFTRQRSITDPNRFICSMLLKES